MANQPIKSKIVKLETKIDGFDHISIGGLPKGRTTLLSGTAGSAKTVFAIQFLVEGIRANGSGGVFVTFEESPPDIKLNTEGFGWEISEWEIEGKFAFVDASPQIGVETIVSGEYDFGALIARVEHAVKKTQATRVSLDSLSAIFNQFKDDQIVRRELFRLVGALKTLGVTSIITAERTQEYGAIGRYGVEEFVADNVIILRNVLEDEKRRRTMEILKYRGTSHQKGEWPFTIMPDKGIVVIPLSAIELGQKSSNIRISSGVSELDEMCGGGFFRDSVILVSGATGTGKTLMSTHFIAGGTAKMERCLLFAFEESREQLFRNANGWGVDFEKMENDGVLKVEARYPETANLEDHLLNIQRVIDEFKPMRVAVDSLSALERVSTIKGFREFVIGLTSFIKHREITGFLTSTTTSLMGGTSITEGHISTITDSIILLRYVEMYGEMQRGVTILKMRGSMHDKSIRQFSIDGKGMHVGKTFRNVVGILAGNPQHVDNNEEIQRMDGLFSDDK